MKNQCKLIGIVSAIYLPLFGWFIEYIFGCLFRGFLKLYQPDVVIMWLWFWDKRYTAPGLFLGETRQLYPEMKVWIFTDDVHYLREHMIGEDCLVCANLFV